MGLIKTFLRIITFGFLGKKKSPEGATREGDIEGDISKKLDRLSSSVDRSPDQVAELESLFIRYQKVIQKNLGKIKNKTRINAQIQAIKQSIERAKNKKKAA